MVAFVTASEYDYRFNLDLDPSGQDDRLPNIENGLNEAQAIVADYIKSGWDEDWTSETLPLGIKSSILMVANALLDGGDRGNAILAGLAENEKTNPVVGMLKRYRDPAMA
jgi:hypothetical protein